MKLFLVLLKRLYLIRWINSALCFLSILTSIFLTALAAYYEELSSLFLVPINFLWWLLIIPVLYLTTEIALLSIYRLAKKLDRTNNLPYDQINKNGIIIFESEVKLSPEYDMTIIGNPACFFDTRINYLDTKTLIKSRAPGITIGLLVCFSIVMNIFLKDIATISNFALILLVLILVIEKVHIEDFPN